jgi:hypothetical protein
MNDSSDLTLWLLVWVSVASVIAYSRSRRGAIGAGLVLAYILNFWLSHWLGAAVSALPWYSSHTSGLVLAGSRQSTYAVIALGVGSSMLAPLLLPALRLSGPGAPRSTPGAPPVRKYVVAGLLGYFILSPVLGRIPTVAAVVAVGLNLVVAGLGLALWQAWCDGSPWRMAGWLGSALCLPFLTIVTQGFLGFGTTAFLSVCAFVAAFYRPRWKLVVLALVVGYLGLSFYVTYMRDRGDIRETVWGGLSVKDRIEQLYLTATTAEWFDPYDTAHLRQIDVRLSQDALVGAAVDYLASGSRDFAAGETLWEAIIALIPRAIWPEKPVVAGSMGLVSRYTGLRFAEGTAVGVGQVLEFYINFGTPGVIVGFLLLGMVLGVVDSVAGQRLREGDWRGFSLWYLPGLALLQVGGSLVDISSSAGAAVVAAFLVNLYLPRGLVGGTRPAIPRGGASLLPPRGRRQEWGAPGAGVG